MPAPRFIHLRVHSDYSMIDGLSKIESLVYHAADMGMPALGLTDYHNLFGLIKFYNAAHEKGLKPIIGVDLRMHCREIGKELVHITALAMNNQGYQNLIVLISKSYLRGYGGSGPTIERHWLVEHQEGLLLLSGGYQGDIGKALLRGNQNTVQAFIKFYNKYFPQRYYIELTRTGRRDEEIYLHQAVALAIAQELPVVATNEVCFIAESDFETHEIRVAIHTGHTLDDTRRPRFYTAQQYFRTEEEMCDLFSDIPEALENSIEIACRCNTTIQLGSYFLPKFPTGAVSTEDFLIDKSKQGLEARLVSLFPNPTVRALRRIDYDKRLEVELHVINQMGFPGYFLIVMEFIQWSKEHSVLVGPGRGSGAGSLVAYALNITDIDPLAFNLIFERFLNPERISMPDFDIDFCMNKRDLVIEHVAEMYGRQAVSQIITFGTMTAKAVIRDVGRVLGHPYSFVDRISKTVPPDPGMTLEKALQCSSRFTELYNTDEEVKTLVEMARKLEGVTRNASKHAGGVVIAPTKITDFSPLYCDENGNHPVTQFDKHDVEYTGLVKFDLLGLRTLTTIDLALDMVNTRRKKKLQTLITLASISLKDKKSFGMLRRAETTAVFQLESRGMKDLMKRLKPDCFEDIIALVALFRPGPLQSGMVDNFINRKHGREKISYPDIQWQHKLLKPVLESTYGIILYQEQVMQIAQVLSGYSLGAADMLRRAMGKKNPIEMAKQRRIFEAGARENGIDGTLAVKIFDLVEKFAGYGFNKSHSVAYALLSYQTLWLKSHYPAEFMAAVMNTDMDNTEKVVILINECWRMGLKVLPPHINISLYNFHVNDQGEIVYGLGAIKGIGAGPIADIIQARNKGGCFDEMFQFCVRINTKKVTYRVLKKLIMSGALDCFGQHRSALTMLLPDALKAANQHIQVSEIGQQDIFGVLLGHNDRVQQKCLDVQPWPENIRLDGERETLGLYLTGHPIDPYLKELQHYVSKQNLKDIHPTKKGEHTTIAGLVVSSRVIETKSGHRIGLCTLDDRSGRVEVKVFTDILDKCKHFLEKDRILVVRGEISLDHFSGGMKIIARDLMDLDAARKRYVHSLTLYLTDEQIDKQIIEQIYSLLAPYRKEEGVPVNVYYKAEKTKLKLGVDVTWTITCNDALLNDLRLLIGSEKVILEFD
ncbi:DNA polymerase III subunit alpha [Candidatus Erwinia haradaeae]|uniref:DNA polymerase III subunit alpha n=1 Tax=Candidatus Erwinia haradaeae TaxID=1922217 RepID=A0A451D9H5_9GAMM|nr:DNA polymerase III subunit alpha [Candidatus Erwinia haradaeae]VFP82962.1 DNA polymerase III subunit alpha [Candidatus Erwinia haradaeae]